MPTHAKKTETQKTRFWVIDNTTCKAARGSHDKYNGS
jgi:hypothetical protein